MSINPSDYVQWHQGYDLPSASANRQLGWKCLENSWSAWISFLGRFKHFKSFKSTISWQSWSPWNPWTFLKRKLQAFQELSSKLSECWWGVGTWDEPVHGLGNSASRKVGILGTRRYSTNKSKGLSSSKTPYTAKGQQHRERAEETCLRYIRQCWEVYMQCWSGYRDWV